LLEAVWEEIHWSVLPKGMAYEGSYDWCDAVVKDDPEFPVTNYHSLVDDREWEGKCNVCHKRFLLKVDLRSNTVERIKPLVENRRLSDDEPMQHGWIRTDECDPFFAVEYWHDKLSPDDIPF
jgi:hypothetical protein